MTEEKFTKKELEQLCVTENIILKRHDPLSNNSFFLPNMEKIGIMIREFDFLVEGASRGRAINEISKTELELFKHEDNPDHQNNLIATQYSKSSIFLEEKRSMIDDKNSENWPYLFTKYFALEDIYRYFHKTESASSFFRKFKIYTELVELNYNLKLMEYLKSQVELLIPYDEDRAIPMHFDSIDLKILIFHQTGFLSILKEKLKNNYYDKGAKLLTTLLRIDSPNWKKIHDILVDIDATPEESILSDKELNLKLKDILYHYKIDLR